MPLEGHAITLDLCRKCQFVWFDRGELDALPKAMVQVNDEDMRRRQANLLNAVQLQCELNAKRDARDIERGAGMVWMVLEIAVRLLLRI